MPVTPQQVASQRVETTVNRLCDLIDKKLQEHKGETTFTFDFINSTPPHVVRMIVDIYKSVGWDARLEESGENVRVLQLLDGSTPQFNPADIKPVAEKFTTAPADRAATQKTMIQSRAATQGQREAIMLNALESGPDGLEALRQAMVEPINTSLMYQSNLRKFLYMIYDATHEENKPKGIYYKSSGVVVDEPALATFKATIRQDRESGQVFPQVDRIQVRGKNAVEDWEDEALFALLSRATSDPSRYNVIETYLETTDRAIRESMAGIESQGAIAAKMIFHPNLFRRVCIDKSGSNYCEATQRDILMTGLYGHYMTTDIHVSPKCPENSIFICAPSHYLGKFWIPPVPNNHSGHHEFKNNTQVVDFKASKKEFELEMEQNSYVTITDQKMVRRIDVRI